MNVKDLVIEFCLHMLDGVLDVITFSAWSRWQGSKVPSIHVVKKEGHDVRSTN